MTGQRGYSRQAVGRMLGITARTVWYYTEEGLVTPDIDNPSGKGTTRLYSAQNVMEIAVARKLAALGLKLDLVRDILRAPRLLRSHDLFSPWDPTRDIDASGARYFLVIYDPGSAHTVIVSTGVEAGRELAVTSRGGTRPNDFEACIVVDLTAIRRWVCSVLA